MIAIHLRDSILFYFKVHYIDVLTYDSSDKNDHKIYGSLNVFTSHKLYILNQTGAEDSTGNIETVFKSCGKGFYWICLDPTAGVTPSYPNITGNIRVFADKYDMEYITIFDYSGISGEVKSLSKLQKLYYFYINRNVVAGVKEDLWNNGANIRTFNGVSY